MASSKKVKTMAGFVVFCQTVASAPVRHFPTVYRAARRVIRRVVHQVVPTTTASVIPTFTKLACRRVALASLGFAGGMAAPAPPVLPARPAAIAPIGPLAALAPGLLPTVPTAPPSAPPATPPSVTPVSPGSPSPVPEPASAGLLLLGAAALVVMRWRGSPRPELRRVRA
jgi:hypothetical protein